MYVAPSYLRAQVASTTEAPVIAMTASARTKVSRRKDKSEVEQIKVMCSIQFSKTTTIVISPVLNNHNYVVLKKPSVVQGFYGENRYSFSHDQIGSANILWRIYLEKFVSDAFCHWGALVVFFSWAPKDASSLNPNVVHTHTMLNTIADLSRYFCHRQND